MRLLMFDEGAGRRLGVLRGEDVVDVAALAAAEGAQAPADLLALIDEGDEGLARVASLVGGPGVGAASRPLSAVRLLPPLDPPRGNVLAIGRNYAKHAAEGARVRGGEVEPPTVFTKAITTIAGPNADVPIDPAVSEQIDWEVELGFVIGKRGINIPKERALDHVFGYTAINDVTAATSSAGGAASSSRARAWTGRARA